MSSGSSGWESWAHPPVSFEQNQPSPKLQASTKKKHICMSTAWLQPSYGSGILENKGQFKH